MHRFIQLLLGIGLTVLLAACGGSGDSNTRNGYDTTTPIPPPVGPQGDNVQPITVNGGPTGVTNLAYTTVTVCVPGTTQCQTINNIIVDTGSTGLRLLSSTLNGLSLPPQQFPAGHTLAQCIPFLDGSLMWGPVRIADVKIGNKTAESAFIQIIAESSYGSAPATCLSNTDPLSTPVEINNVATLGANGILGIGHFREDCGQYCETVAGNNYYYDCSNGSCVNSAADTTLQVLNPIALFDGDNNGVIIQLPAVADGGAARVDGWMIFGIDTRANNALGSATKLTVDGAGNLTTTYGISVQSNSFIDSGSNALYFFDNSIAICSGSLTPFFCPASTLNLSATLTGQNNASAAVNFRVANAAAMNSAFYAHNNLAGFYFGDFDWGLPFFYGRKVYTALETNPGGPYVAF